MATARRERRRLMGEINVVPYIDVMLVLLIIFMITAPLLAQGVKVDLPRAQAEAITQVGEYVKLQIDAQGRLYLNVGDDPRRPLDPQTVMARVAAVLRQAPQTPVYVEADQTLPYGKVVEAMALLTQAGAPRVGLMTEPPPPVRRR